MSMIAPPTHDCVNAIADRVRAGRLTPAERHALADLVTSVAAAQRAQHTVAERLPEADPATAAMFVAGAWSPVGRVFDELVAQ